MRRVIPTPNCLTENGEKLAKNDPKMAKNDPKMAQEQGGWGWVK